MSQKLLHCARLCLCWISQCSVDVAHSYSCSLIHANPLLLTLLLTYLQICVRSYLTSAAPPPLPILSLADSVIHKWYIGGYSLSMPDARRLFSDLSFPSAAAQIKYLTLHLFPEHSFCLPLPCIKYSSDLRRVESTLHKSLNIRPPRQEPFALYCLNVFALSVYLAFHCCGICNFCQIPEGGHPAQEAPSGDDRAVQQANNQVGWGPPKCSRCSL